MTSTTHTDGVVTIEVVPDGKGRFEEKVEPHPEFQVAATMSGPAPEGYHPAVAANRVLAGRVTALEKLNDDLRERLATQAGTIVRQRQELADERTKATTLVVPPEVKGKDWQFRVEGFRSTIAQQKARIDELRAQKQTVERELLHSDDLIREHRRTIQHLQESITTLVGEVRGYENECERLRHLATCRLHHINSLEDVLEGRASLLATVNLLGLEEHLQTLGEDIDLLGEVVKEILDERTRTGVVNR